MIHNLPTLERKHQLKSTTERRHRVQKLAVDYINRSGMAKPDFARRIGYAHSTLNLFLRDQYHHVGADDSQICAAILNFLDLYPVGASDEFRAQLYEIGNVKVLRNVFARLFERPQAYMLYAPPGSGKTDVAKMLIAEHNRAMASGTEQKQHIFYVYCRQGIRPRDLMRRVAQSCGAVSAGDIDRMIANLRWEFRNAQVTLYLDEAQHLDLDGFETLRELLDQEPRFSLVFAGSHELETIFKRFAGTLEQLERRITDKVTLPAVTREEASNIVRSELKDLLPDLDRSMIAQQIDLATVSVRVKRESQSYISIGRLMAAVREIRESLSEQEAAQPQPVTEEKEAIA
ncbi:MAG: AAA family ATPase [Acidobacteriaceae bacterium]